MIPDEAQLYADRNTTAESPLLARLNRETHVQLLHARMLSGHAQGRLLSMISHMVRPRRVLELGTFTGYSALCLAEGLAPDGVLHTIEQNPELESRIRRYVQEAGQQQQIQLHIGDARQLLPSLPETWDLVFIDADKPGNPGYVELALQLTRPGSVIVVDNVVRHGAVADAGSDDPGVLGSREVLTLLGGHPRLDATALQTVGAKGWDGFAVARVR